MYLKLVIQQMDTFDLRLEAEWEQRACKSQLKPILEKHLNVVKLKSRKKDNILLVEFTYKH